MHQHSLSIFRQSHVKFDQVCAILLRLRESGHAVFREALRCTTMSSDLETGEECVHLKEGRLVSRECVNRETKCEKSNTYICGGALFVFGGIGENEECKRDEKQAGRVYDVNGADDGDRDAEDLRCWLFETETGHRLDRTRDRSDYLKKNFWTEISEKNRILMRMDEEIRKKWRISITLWQNGMFLINEQRKMSVNLKMPHKEEGRVQAVERRRQAGESVRIGET